MSCGFASSKGFTVSVKCLKLNEAFITSHNFHILFKIGLMKGFRYFAEVLGQSFRRCSAIVHRSRTWSTEKI